MKKIDWSSITYFSQNEFSENPIYAEPELFYKLDFVRSKLNQKIFPSPAKGSLARFFGNSKTQHYAIGRKSTAVDVFCEGYPIVNFLSLLQMHTFNGIGIYLDTDGPDGKPWVMFHLDIRRTPFSILHPFIWVTTRTHQKNSYFYPQQKPEYWKLLRHDILFEKRIKIKKTPEAN